MYGREHKRCHKYKHQPEVSQPEGENKRHPRCPTELVKCFVTEAGSFSSQKKDLQKIGGLIYRSRKLPQYESRVSFTI